VSVGWVYMVLEGVEMGWLCVVDFTSSDGTRIFYIHRVYRGLGPLKEVAIFFGHVSLTILLAFLSSS
jgi:hypothetical protein